MRVPRFQGTAAVGEKQPVDENAAAAKLLDKLRAKAAAKQAADGGAGGGASGAGVGWGALTKPRSNQVVPTPTGGEAPARLRSFQSMTTPNPSCW